MVCLIICFKETTTFHISLLWYDIVYFKYKHFKFFVSLERSFTIEDNCLHLDSSFLFLVFSIVNVKLISAFWFYWNILNVKMLGFTRPILGRMLKRFLKSGVKTITSCPWPHAGVAMKATWRDSCMKMFSQPFSTRIILWSAVKTKLVDVTKICVITEELVSWAIVFRAILIFFSRF